MLGIVAIGGTVSIICTSGIRNSSHVARNDPAWFDGSLFPLSICLGSNTLVTLRRLFAICNPFRALTALWADAADSYSKKQYPFETYQYLIKNKLAIIY